MNIQYKTILNSDVTVSYVTVNESLGGIPLVIIPGMINSADEVVSVFSEHCHTYHIIISLRGRGKSSSPESGYSLSEQASDIQAVLESGNIASCVIFGHSTGASIGIRAASKFPKKIQAYIIGDFPPFYPPYEEMWATQVLSFGDAIDITPIAVHGIAKDAEYTDLLDELNDLLCDVYLIKATGEDSLLRTVDVQKFQELCERSTVLELAESGHEMLNENPKELARILTEIVEQVQ